MAKPQLSPTAGQDVSAYIRQHLGEIITYTTIDDLCGTNSSNLQYNLIVGPLVKDRVLTVSRRKLIRGNDQAPIYRSYRICKKLPADLPCSGSFMLGTANIGTTDKTLAGLNPKLAENGFLSKNPEAAKAWHDELAAFGTWLEAHPEPVAPVSSEERSFEVFRNEKLLLKGERKGGTSLIELLSNIGLYPQLQIQSEVAQELAYYVPHTLRRTLSILIVENHVPYVHLRNELKRGARVFFGRRVDGVVYGKGYNVVAEHALSTVETLFSEGRSVRYLYWGDIDRPGIDVFDRLASLVEVEPLMPAYREMLDRAGEVLPASSATTIPPHMGITIATQLDARQLETYIGVLVQGLRIPQEAVPKEAFGATHGARRLTETLRHRSDRLA